MEDLLGAWRRGPTAQDGAVCASRRGRGRGRQQQVTGMGIYRVNVYGKTRAELEVAADGTIICTGAGGGAASHFEVPLRDLVFAEQVSHDTVLLNFFHNGDADSMVQVSRTSDNCASV